MLDPFAAQIEQRVFIDQGRHRVFEVARYALSSQMVSYGFPSLRAGNELGEEQAFLLVGVKREDIILARLGGTSSRSSPETCPDTGRQVVHLGETLRQVVQFPLILDEWESVSLRKAANTSSTPAE